MSSWRCKEENPVVCPTGVFIGGPDQRTSKFVSESHPAMIVAGCPVPSLETGAGCLFRCFSPARVSLSSLWRSVYLCAHCDRGQRYCRPHCREKSRRLQRREANRRYHQSLGLDGRLDHRQRQREYRQRLKGRVTDQSSFVLPPM